MLFKYPRLVKYPRTVVAGLEFGHFRRLCRPSPRSRRYECSPAFQGRDCGQRVLPRRVTRRAAAEPLENERAGPAPVSQRLTAQQAAEPQGSIAQFLQTFYATNRMASDYCPSPREYSRRSGGTAGAIVPPERSYRPRGTIIQ